MYAIAAVRYEIKPLYGETSVTYAQNRMKENDLGGPKPGRVEIQKRVFEAMMSTFECFYCIFGACGAA